MAKIFSLILNSADRDNLLLDDSKLFDTFVETNGLHQNGMGKLPLKNTENKRSCQSKSKVVEGFKTGFHNFERIEHIFAVQMYN